MRRCRPWVRATAAVVPWAIVALAATGWAQEVLPPPPDSMDTAPAPTPPEQPAGPKRVTCPRCGYRCDPVWHYCVACGWDLTALVGQAEESRLQVIARATVGVIVGGRRNRFASAFPFGGSGLFLTNARYLIGGDESRTHVRTFNNREYPATIVGYDLPSGVGVLKAEIPGLLPPGLAPDPLAPPESSWAVCYPIVFEDDVVRYLPVSLHRGRVTATGQAGTFFVTFENLLRSDHSIEDGCSGGPLVDSRGRVAGMILGSPDDGITYAIPLQGLTSIVESLDRRERPARPYFGIGLVVPDERRRAKFGIEAAANQPMVAYLIPESPAAKAGLRPGEFLLAVGADRVTTVWEAGRRLLAAATDGPGVALTLSSGGVERRVTVKPVSRPERIMLDPVDELQETLEANLKEIAAGAGAQQGLLVTDLVRGGRGEKRLFRNGDIITAVDKRSVKTFAAFDQVIRTSFKNMFATDKTAADRRFASSYFVTLEVRKEGEEKVTRDYVNFFPDILAPPVY